MQGWLASLSYTSINVKHPLDFRLTVLHGPSEYLKVVTYLYISRTMGVPAKNRHALLRILLHELQQYLSSNHACEVWSPVVIGKSPITPARFAKWRNMHQHQNMVTAFECVGKYETEMDRCFVPEVLEYSHQVF